MMMKMMVVAEKSDINRKKAEIESQERGNFSFFTPPHMDTYISLHVTYFEKSHPTVMVLNFIAYFFHQICVIVK